jgi:hypothetical protein
MTSKTRYFVEWSNEKRARRLMLKRGGHPNESLWDYVQEHEITEEMLFPTRARAFKWGKENADRDMHVNPRVREQSLVLVTDLRGKDTGKAWEETGYWEYDGSAFVPIVKEA